jgi:hypothetical protein
MGLYLCVFAGDNEVAGVEVGSYADFNAFRNTVVKLVENGVAGSRCPVLIDHPDSDGDWPPAECVLLRDELSAIAETFRMLPPARFPEDYWQQQVAEQLGLQSGSLYDSFIDVDGEPLIERLIDLCDVAIESKAPILFQ